MQKSIAKQKGAALIIFFIVLVLAAMSYLVSQLDGTSIKIERDKKTASALAEAKVALIGFAAKSGAATGAARPGEFPCPDIDNNGTSDGPCTANVIGRLPWKTLGISDLRDGDDERLWYAVSANFENVTRANTLNSETVATLTLRDSSGTILNDGSLTTGLVAVVISPSIAMTRQDAVIQVRSTVANQNNAVNYLDIAFGEDNSNFINGNTNGFIKGPINDVNNNLILNDKLITIAQDELMDVVEPRVIAAVSNALLDFYCGGVANANYVTKGCSAAGGNRFFPRPASFSDTTCLGTSNISGAGKCASNVATNHGRIPVILINSATYFWNATSILRGTPANSIWFQKNAWREQIHYAVAPACVDGTVNCSGFGMLTLNFALTNPTSRVVVTAAGRTQTGQLRTLANRGVEANYLEDENALPLDDVYTRTVAPPPPVVLFNDRSVNIP